ncbi:MAG TPA: helix-turn-helix domain-containing protein [Burkholderiales bacterium]|nr:helix-turn-helix domain-containing protein [Burkholderiales bacterium]
MPNIGAVLKEEITRLSRKELRRQLGGMKKTYAQHRRHIAALRRQIGGLERELSALRARVLARGSGVATAPEATKTRFVAKGLRARRTRLGLSAEDYGRLVGVSAQTIYSWERKTSIPRAAQRTSLAAIRSIGKREAHTRLEALTPRGGKRARGSRK